MPHAEIKFILNECFECRVSFPVESFVPQAGQVVSDLKKALHFFMNNTDVDFSIGILLLRQCDQLRLVYFGLLSVARKR